jgi:magnesium transporter
VERGVIYLSTPVVAASQTAAPALSPAGFILSQRLLVTVRFTPLSTFDAVAERIRVDEELRSSVGVFASLMESIVDRGADVLEHLGAELDRVSRSVFRGDPNQARHPARSSETLRLTLSQVGDIGDRISLVRDALLGIGRITHFASDIGHAWIAPDFHARLGAVAKDVASLNDFETQLANKVQFLLDAVLGFITIAQNDLFKVLTIVSVVGIPPTLVAGIYGMNFKNMPELNWAWGYPFGLAVIALSAVLPLI